MDSKIPEYYIELESKLSKSDRDRKYSEGEMEKISNNCSIFFSNLSEDSRKLAAQQIGILIYSYYFSNGGISNVLPYKSKWDYKIKKFIFDLTWMPAPLARMLSKHMEDFAN